MKLKRIKKVLAIVLMVAMVIQLLPAMKSLQADAASDYVRIKNVWQQTYLYQSGDKVVYGNVDSSNQSSHWQISNVSDGTVRIMNRSTGDYMHIENLYGYVQCGDINMDWSSAKWLKTDAGNGEVRLSNYWQRSQYIHVENLNGNAQSGSIYDAWSSAKWVVETVEEAETEAPTTEVTTQAPETEATTAAPETEATTQAPETEAEQQTTVAVTESVTTSYSAGSTSCCSVGGGASQDGSSVGNLHISGAYAEFYNINGGNGGSAEIVLHYASNDGSPRLAVYVNGSYATTASLSSTGGWGNYTGTYTFTANLNAGSNTIKFVHDNLGVNISSIDVTVNKNSEAETEAPTQAPETEAETEATTQAPETEATTQAPETEAETEATTQAPAVENNTSGITIYFYGNGWSSAYLWSWNGYSTNSWPGDAFTKVSGTNNWWKLTVSASALTGYIQETGGGTGCDKTFGTISGYGTYFVVYNNNAETLYTSQSAAESAAGETLSGGSTSSGGTTTEPETQAPTVDSGSSADGRVVGYNVPSGKTTSSNVSMSANGVSVGVFDTTVNNTHTWVGYYPQLSSARVAIFDFEGTAKVTLTVNYYVSSATIRPVGDGVTPTITHNGNTTYISFTIKQAGQYSVELNGNLTDAIMIFASAIENAPSGNVIKVSSGEARYENITVGNGQTLYIEGGGAVYGRVFCQTGSTVCGRGIIDQSHMDTWGGSNGQYPMSIEFASNVHVSGVSVLNSSCWNYQIYNSSNVYLNNIKIVSARPNGDGVSIQSSSYVYVNDSFIRTWDDGIVLKNYSSNNTHDVYCDNIVFWTDLAQAMEIGVETNAGYGGVPADPAIYAVDFTNIDVIHALHKAAISIHNGDNAEIYDIKWENVTMEDCSPGQGDGWNLWLDFTTCYPTDFGGSSAWAHNWDGTGTIHDVTLKNIQVTSSTNAGHRVWDWWVAQGTGYSIYNITCENVYVNGSAFKY